MVALLPLLWRLLPYALGAIALGVAYYQAQHWCNSACTDARAEASELREQIALARKHRDELAVKWADAIQKTERIYVESRAAREDDFQRIRERASTGSPSSVRIPLDALSAGLLRDAHRIANSDPSAPVRIDEAAPTVSTATGATVDEWKLTYIDAAAAYADAKAGWLGCVQSYEALRVP